MPPSAGAREREFGGGLAAACGRLGLKEGRIITLDEEGEMVSGGVKINVLPAWKFLLDS